MMCMCVCGESCGGQMVVTERFFNLEEVDGRESESQRVVRAAERSERLSHTPEGR